MPFSVGRTLTVAKREIALVASKSVASAAAIRSSSSRRRRRRWPWVEAGQTNRLVARDERDGLVHQDQFSLLDVSCGHEDSTLGRVTADLEW